jgi:hypothetical protein
MTLLCQQGLGIAPPAPSPTEPKVSLHAAQSELQVARHILHLKELLHANQSQLNAGMGAAGLLKSGIQQKFPASPNFNSISIAPTLAFTPIAAPSSHHLPSGQSTALFTHNADGTRYAEETTIVSVPSRTNSFEGTSNSLQMSSPNFSPSGYVRRQA